MLPNHLESDRLLAAIVESSDDAIVSKDLNGVVTSWNRGAERIFGYTPREIVGKSITLIIPPELQDDEPRILAKIRAGERIDHFETVRLHKDGHRIDISLTVSPVRDSQGRIVGAAKIARDISEKKRLEAAIRTNERLAAVGRLAAAIAHEINNPLEAVINLVYLAQRTPGLPELVRGHLIRADRELARVSHIAQQTMAFYRDGSRPTALLVSDVIDDLVVIYERKIALKGLTIERKVRSDLTVVASEGELKQVLSNLITNAIDACESGGKLTIRGYRIENSRTCRHGVRIVVADNGRGIPAEHRRRVFAPFFTTKETGTGLGLWVSKELVEKRGGSIHIRSRQSHPSGTVVSIYLPLDIAKPAAA
ncbi:MAG TPA: PAS domain S-box protein [Bryocella sp.]|nr:PAS domain S-box protein [Bryocella sp.]